MLINHKHKKILYICLAFILSVGCVISGAFALMSYKTEKVTNTFVIGDINLTLKESDNLSFKLTPNATLKKDPKLTVLADSVDSYVFVEIEESENLDSFVSYSVADGWIPLDGYPNIYYRNYSSTETNITYSVLLNDSVTVKDYSKDDISSVSDKPTLSFIGYAIQKEGVETPESAWIILTENYS